LKDTEPHAHSGKLKQKTDDPSQSQVQSDLIENKENNADSSKQDNKEVKKKSGVLVNTSTALTTVRILILIFLIL
jgi:hypothetical protein